MSIRVMTAVWDDADVAGGNLLVLLAMADVANDDGGDVYLKQETLAHKARMKPRNVRNCLRELEQFGYIERVAKRTGGVVEWRVRPDPANIAARHCSAAKVGTGVPTEPLRNHSNTSSSSPDPQAVAGSSAPTPPVPAAPPAPESTGRRFAPRLVMLLAELMRANDPKARLPGALREEGGVVTVVGDGPKEWMDAARLLIDRDERHPEEVLEVLRWCQADEFWRANVLSMTTFRRQYPKLRGHWQRALQAAGGTRPAGPDSRRQAARISGWLGHDDKARRAGAR